MSLRLGMSTPPTTRPQPQQPTTQPHRLPLQRIQPRLTQKNTPQPCRRTLYNTITTTTNTTTYTTTTQENFPPGELFTLFTPRVEHTLLFRGKERIFTPGGDQLHLKGPKFIPGGGATSPLGLKFAPRGEIENRPLAANSTNVLCYLFRYLVSRIHESCSNTINHLSDAVDPAAKMSGRGLIFSLSRESGILIVTNLPFPSSA
jgi:hypothetical protein